MGVVVDVGHLSVRDVECLSENLGEFMKPYLEVAGWSSREKQLSAFVAGLLGGTERKSVEPIALAQGVDRRGRGTWRAASEGEDPRPRSGSRPASSSSTEPSSTSLARQVLGTRPS